MSGRLGTQRPTVAACASGAITLSGAQTVDGVTLTAGMLCLVAGNGADNDVYLVQSGAWMRLLPPGALTVMVAGGANAGTWAGSSGGEFAKQGGTPSPAQPMVSLIDRAVALGMAETFTGDYSLGCAFSAVAAVTITGARIYRSAMGSASVKVTLYARDKTTVLATKTATLVTGANLVTFDAPVARSVADGLAYLQFYNATEYYNAQKGDAHIGPYLPAAPWQAGSLLYWSTQLYNGGDTVIGTPDGNHGLIEPVLA